MSSIQDIFYKYVNKCQLIIDTDIDNSKILLQSVKYDDTQEPTIINRCYNKHKEIELELCNDINIGIYPVRELLFINDTDNKIYISCRKI